MLRLRPIITCGIWLVPAMCGAHPGHGTTDPESVVHWVEPVHLGPVLFLAVACLTVSAVVRWKRDASRSRSQRRSQER